MSNLRRKASNLTETRISHEQKTYKYHIVNWCPGAESNHRHEDFQSTALPLSYPGTGNDFSFGLAGCRSGKIGCPDRFRRADQRGASRAEERWGDTDPGIGATAGMQIHRSGPWSSHPACTQGRDTPLGPCAMFVRDRPGRRGSKRRTQMSICFNRGTRGSRSRRRWSSR